MVMMAGWFPFLFYSATWVGETYFRYEAPKSVLEKSKDMLGDVGRMGSLSLVIFSLITLIGSIVLPFGVLSPETKKSSADPRLPRGIVRMLKKVSMVRPDLQTMWMVSHLLFAGTMVFAPFARSVSFATFLVAICGIPWAVSSWAPFAFMGVEINRLALSSASSTRNSRATMIGGSRHGPQLPVDAMDETGADVELNDNGSVLRLNHHGSFDSDVENDIDENESTTGELAGIYLGVLNVYTTLPQFLGTFISWIVFSILEPDRTATTTGAGQQEDDAQWMDLNSEGANPIGVCLFIGAMSALVAAEATRRMRLAR